MNFKGWTHRAEAAASSIKHQIEYIGSMVTLGNRSHPIFKRHNAFQWTLTLPLTLGVFIPLEEGFT